MVGAGEWCVLVIVSAATSASVCCLIKLHDTRCDVTPSPHQQPDRSEAYRAFEPSAAEAWERGSPLRSESHRGFDIPSLARPIPLYPDPHMARPYDPHTWNKKRLVFKEVTTKVHKKMKKAAVGFGDGSYSTAPAAI